MPRFEVWHVMRAMGEWGEGGSVSILFSPFQPSCPGPRQPCVAVTLISVCYCTQQRTHACGTLLQPLYVSRSKIVILNS